MAVGLVIVLGGLLNMGIFLRVGGEFLTIVTGLSVLHLEIVMTGLLLMVMIYTALGGMLSVLITDYLQFLVMGTGLVVVSLLVAANVSWGDLVGAVEKAHGAGGFNPFVSEGMGMTYVIWQACNQLAAVITWQTVIQRVLSARDSGTARRVYTRTSFYFVGRFLIPGFWGMAALAVLGAGTQLDSLHAMPTYLAMLLPTAFWAWWWRPCWPRKCRPIPAICSPGVAFYTTTS